MRHFALTRQQSDRVHAVAGLIQHSDRDGFLADATHLLRQLDRPASDSDVNAVLHRLLGVVPIHELVAIDLILFPKFDAPAIKPN